MWFDRQLLHPPLYATRIRSTFAYANAYMYRVRNERMTCAFSSYNFEVRFSTLNVESYRTPGDAFLPRFLLKRLFIETLLSATVFLRKLERLPFKAENIQLYGRKRDIRRMFPTLTYSIFVRLRCDIFFRASDYPSIRIVEGRLPFSPERYFPFKRVAEQEIVYLERTSDGIEQEKGGTLDCAAQASPVAVAVAVAGANAGDKDPVAKRMKDVWQRSEAYASNLSNIRQRKVERKVWKNEMVGLGSDESLGSSVSDIRIMETDTDTDTNVNTNTNTNTNRDRDIEMEMKREEEAESDGEPARPLIQSSVEHRYIGDDRKESGREGEEENVWSISVQMLVPFLLAGFGMVAASLLLDVVQHWPVYQSVSEVYILVPALLGLKGNLEMTLASRISTHANLGHMDTKKQRWTLVIGNLALIQCQAAVVGLLASLAAVVLGWIPEAQFDIYHTLLLCASALTTASIASLLLSLVMIAVILLSKEINIDPDNVATPIAASLGDLTTLMLLSGIASLLYSATDYAPWIAPVLIVFHIATIPVWGYIAARNPFTKEILDYGWAPVICAMLISSMGGLILDYTISNYKGIAVFQLVINGVGGNLAAVQASRISTSLHKDRRSHSEGKTLIYLNPLQAFCAKGGHARIARILLSMVIPGHLIFGYTISYLQAGHTSFTPIFLIFYLSAALLQVILLLYITELMVAWMWTRGMDPDSSAIPYITAAGDLIGTVLLGIAFHVLYSIGDGDSDVGD